jgi:hypothetical protein
VSGDIHTPTNAGAVAMDSGGGFGTSAGAHGVDAQPTDKPEVQVGAAFAGGLVAAMILKRIFARN